MNVEDFREFCLSLPAAVERAPWSDPSYQSLITFSIGDKWFTLLALDEERCNIKVNPQTVIEMRERYDGAHPAWHMNKTHWLGIILDSDIPDDKIRELVREGYDLIVKRLTRAKRAELGL